MILETLAFLNMQHGAHWTILHAASFVWGSTTTRLHTKLNTTRPLPEHYKAGRALGKHAWWSALAHAISDQHSELLVYCKKPHAEAGVLIYHDVAVAALAITKLALCETDSMIRARKQNADKHHNTPVKHTCYPSSAEVRNQPPSEAARNTTGVACRLDARFGHGTSAGEERTKQRATQPTGNCKRRVQVYDPQQRRSRHVGFAYSDEEYQTMQAQAAEELHARANKNERNGKVHSPLTSS
jgi:hypothetical protein